MPRPVPDQPQPGQESVWDFPRPAVAAASGRHVVIMLADMMIADTRAAVRTLETSLAPTYYVPMADIAMDALRETDGSTLCEWKGIARYFDVVVGDQSRQRAAWTYRRPTAPFAAIGGCIAFYPALVDCFVDGERASPQDGGFYGGWITSDLAGPFKGGPGTEGW